jgi:PBP4 family serine-type D-alanyl-D-alanine carboxypeptidase
MAELKQLGIRKVTGDIIVDASIFDDVPYGSGWMVSDLNEGYSAPVSGISVDHNRMVFGFFPGATSHSPAHITIFPDTNYFTIQNHARTSNGKTSHGIKLSLASKEGIKKGSHVLVEGRMPLASPVKYDSLAIHNPPEFAAQLMKEQLKKNGIAFQGKLRKDKMSSTAKLVTHHYSPPLSEMIIDFAKMSNNHATETLLKTIGAVHSGEPGRFETGILAVRHFLENVVGVSLTGMVAADGSGLSRYNQVSAKQMTDLLAYMWNSFHIGPEFVTCLAIFGEDGTLKRSKEASLNGNVRAKTGSMRNLHSLAGYLHLDSGDVVAFAVLTHGSSNNPQSQKRVIEEILTTVKGRVASAKTALLH